MGSIIIGNGINIRFGGEDFSNYQILNRLSNGSINVQNELQNSSLPTNIKGYWNPKFNNELILAVLKKYFEKISSGEMFENYTLNELNRIKTKVKYKDKRLEKKMQHNKVIELENSETYKKIKILWENNRKNPDYRNLGLEDYFFILDYYIDEKNEETKYINKFIKIVYNILIYNHGQCNDVFYDESTTKKISEFNNIFTLNYDNVIENNLRKMNLESKVMHLHGSFDVLSGYYNKKHPLGFKDVEIDNYDLMLNECRNEYFCNSLYASKGDEKYKEALGISTTNMFYSSFEVFYESLFKIQTLTNIKISGRTKQEWENYFLDFDKSLLYNYHFDKLQELEGSITLYGISPNNDSHIIDIINSNPKISDCIFYYYNQQDIDLCKLYIKKPIILKKYDLF